MTFVTYWLIAGVISAVWNFLYDLGVTKELGFCWITEIATAALHLILGPISLIITIWEKFFDPSNI